ncbi:L-aspartate oxidase [uncultured Arthrobacter sp.]|uniref:L-aspartate oxidase n=1 Tax=uncultured Arthrobacter sp. TaxID=114050 RepID=UPI002636E8E1|nr:L-aspartate oxidase [uncultured Arthrobacter sp.]
MNSVLVIGGGIAGLYTALELRRSDTHVTVLAKGTLAESSTWHAQGGIAAVLPGPHAGVGSPTGHGQDSVESHVADTIAAGAGHCDEPAVRILCSEAAAHIERLGALGTLFDRTADGSLAVGREAAHAASRILHIGGDATGEGIAAPLIRAARKDPGISVQEHSFAADLATRNGEVTGVVVLRHGEQQMVPADAVVLASGGAGGIFQHSTNPSVATGDGVAAAWRAGAAVADLEFFQFHPTALNVPGHPLISEAVRGEGAVLLDAAGRRFMTDYHPGGELAPRDVVSRSIALHLARTGGQEVFLDATSLGSDYLARRFPTLTAVTGQAGFDWTRDLLPVVPAAHYWMGGVWTDTHGRTSLPGLYAVGEVARTGVHGANRLASNSLLEGLVFGARAAAALAAGPAEWPTVEADAVELADGPMQAVRGDVQRVMSEHVSLVREDSGLRIAAKQLAEWRSAEGSRAEREDANLLLCSRLMAAAAFRRRESRGAHYRVDFPAMTEGPGSPTILRSAS